MIRILGMILVWSLILTMLRSSKWRRRGRTLWRRKILIKLFLVLGRFQGMNSTSQDCFLVHLMPHHHPVFSLSLEKSFLLWPKSIVHKANNDKGMREEKEDSGWGEARAL